jgi:hypothetical protein
MPLREVGKFPRGQAASRTVYCSDFRGGLNVAASGQALGDTDLTIAYNGYLSTTGAFSSRFGLSDLTGQIAAAAAVNGFRFYQGIVNGTPVMSPTAHTYSIVQLGSNIYNENGSLIGSVGSAQPMSWCRVEDPNDPHFVSGLTDVAVMCTGTGGPYVWDGTNLYTPAGWSQASGASWCAVVNGIIWFGGIANFPNQIFGSGDGITASMETLPAYRNFSLTGPVLGLVAQGTGANASLVIGRNAGISVLYGTGPSTFYLQDVPMTDGMPYGHSALAYAGSVVWVGTQSVWLFDGVSIPRSISEKIRSFIEGNNSPNQYTPAFGTNYPITTNDGCSPLGAIWNSRYHIIYSASGGSVPDTVLCYDFLVGGWTVVQTTPAISCLWSLDAPADFSTGQDNAGQARASAGNGHLYAWETVGLADSNTGCYDITTTVGPTTYAPVLSQMATKFFKLGAPGTTKALRRTYPELTVLGPAGLTGVVATDYGATTSTQPQPASTSAFNDIFVPSGSPTTRVDWDQVTGDAFSFGIQNTVASGPWTVGGFSAAYHQRSMT